MTVRLAACREIAEDKVAVSKLIGIYWDLERGVSPISVLLPWFPSAARKRKNTATKELYMMLYTYIEARRNAVVPNTDTIDVFIADGCSTATIVSVRKSLPYYLTHNI
jgi:sterol 14-demethylase